MKSVDSWQRQGGDKRLKDFQLSAGGWCPLPPGWCPLPPGWCPPPSLPLPPSGSSASSCYDNQRPGSASCHNIFGLSRNNNTINIQLLNHADTDYSHLTPKDYMMCIKNCNTCVKTLIEKVHFNPDKPENMNIFLSNIKGNYVMIYKDNEWQIRNKKRQLDDLYDSNEVVLETWYDEYKDKYPHIINSFKRYLKNRDGDVVLNRVKDDILMMLYNKRKMIPSSE